MSPDDSRPWWHTAVFYQIYPRSFADGNGDGTGDLPGVVSRLDYLRDLGVDALWLSPFYRSPMADGGYDVADPRDVDPLFGTLADFDLLVAAAHQRDIRVTIDLVPNHVSVEHAWFRAALAAGPDSRERERFIFRRGRGEHGESPPNNWPSMFGGPAWTRARELTGDSTDEQWYLHLFAAEQPDLNWSDPEVPDEFERIMRFWLDRGVDGFRIDVAHAMAKEPGLPDVDPAALRTLDSSGTPAGADIRWDRDGVHEFHRRFRRVLNDYPGERIAVGEAWVADPQRLARYVRPDELNLTFNFELTEQRWGAAGFRAAIERSLAAMSAVGAPCTWVLDNHDVHRAVTRFGDGPRGLARARAGALMLLSLPGVAFVYNGDELGLPTADVPEWARVDPVWERSGHTLRGRDGERVPLPWSGSEPPFGFTTAATTWLPMPPEWAPLSVQAQLADPASTLSLYRTAIAMRHRLADLRTGAFAWQPGPPQCLSYRRGRVQVLLNAGSQAVPLPGGEQLLSSTPTVGGQLPPDAAAWVRVRA